MAFNLGGSGTGGQLTQDDTMGLGGVFNDMPIFDQFLESDREAAGVAKLAMMEDAIRQYDAYRDQAAQQRQQAVMNMAGMMGGLNEFVKNSTGYGMDLGAATAPVTSMDAGQQSQFQAPGGGGSGMPFGLGGMMGGDGMGPGGGLPAPGETLGLPAPGSTFGLPTPGETISQGAGTVGITGRAFADLFTPEDQPRGTVKYIPPEGA